MARRLGRWASSEWPDNVHFADGYNQRLAHTIFAGSDLLLMPSRFEPCGLAQMQAMAYGTIPVVTDVGGLHDTVIDADADRKKGTGFLATTVDVPGVVDALHRSSTRMAAQAAPTIDPEERHGPRLVVDPPGATSY